MKRLAVIILSVVIGLGALAGCGHPAYRTPLLGAGGAAAGAVIGHSVTGNGHGAIIGAAAGAAGGLLLGTYLDAQDRAAQQQYYQQQGYYAPAPGY